MCVICNGFLSTECLHFSTNQVSLYSYYPIFPCKHIDLSKFKPTIVNTNETLAMLIEFFIFNKLSKVNQNSLFKKKKKKSNQPAVVVLPFCYIYYFLFCLGTPNRLNRWVDGHPSISPEISANKTRLKNDKRQQMVCQFLWGRLGLSQWDPVFFSENVSKCNQM